MPDAWEEQHGLNPNSPADSPDWILDYDNDGYINVEEYINEVAEWPAPYDIVFTGGTNARYEQITNWSITRPSPGEADTTTHWQPSRFDVAVINNGNVTVDSVGQHAGTIRLATGAGDNASLNITGGWLKVEDAPVGPGNGEVIIGAHAVGDGHAESQRRQADGEDAQQRRRRLVQFHGRRAQRRDDQLRPGQQRRHARPRQLARRDEYHRRFHDEQRRAGNRAGVAPAASIRWAWPATLRSAAIWSSSC